MGPCLDSHETRDALLRAVYCTDRLSLSSIRGPERSRPQGQRAKNVERAYIPGNYRYSTYF